LVETYTNTSRSCRPEGRVKQEAYSNEDEKGKAMKEAKEKKNPEISVSITISTWGAFAVYVITGLFLIFGFHVVRNKYSVDLISDPTLTLRLLWIIEFPIVVIIYSLFRRNPEKCSYFRAVGRSLVGLIAG
jgi:phosphatidylinositol glycan class F